MKKPELDAYLRLAVRALPDATLVQTANAALWDSQPDNASRADAALTVALGALTLLDEQFDKTADWVRSTVTL